MVDCLGVRPAGLAGGDVVSWLGRILAQAFARRLAFVVVAALLAWAGIGRAEAQTSSCVLQTGSGYASTWVNCASREDAYNKASELAALIPANYLQGKCTPWEIASRPVQWNGAKAYTAGAANANGCTWKPGLASWPGAECPIGKSWDDAKKRCAVQCPGGFGEDPYNPGQCMDEDKCTARNSSINTSALRIGGDTCVNLGGCAFEADTSGSLSAATSEASLTMYPYSYSGRPGSACAAPPPPDPEPPEPKPECIPAGGGQTMCIRPDGQHCYSSAPGKSSGFCWKPGETGEQTNGPDRQDRKPGNDPPPPNLNLTNGDTLQPKPGGPITSTTNTGGNTIITTVINYGTTNGTNAGSGTGKPDSGTGDITKPGTGTGGQGDGEGKGSTGGGQDCETPLTVQGGDPVIGEIAKQTWQVRCKGDADGDGVADVLGDEGDGYGDEPGGGDVVKDGGDGEGFSLDSGGFLGGGACPGLPTFEIGGQTVDLSASVCDLSAILAGLVLIAAYAHAMWILGAAFSNTGGV